MDFDEIPPPTDPQPAPASLFLSNAYVYHSDTLRFSNIHSAINTPLIADALAEFALSQDTREYSLSKFMCADHISQALIENRPSITKTRNAGPGIPYSIHIRIDRREIGELVPRLYSFKVMDGKRQCIVYAQFLSIQESLVCQQPDALNFITLRGLACGWDPLDNLSYNGGLEALQQVLKMPFALIRLSLIHI